MQWTHYIYAIAVIVSQQRLLRIFQIFLRNLNKDIFKITRIPCHCYSEHQDILLSRLRQHLLSTM